MTAVRATIEAMVAGRTGYETGLDLLAVSPATEVDPVLTRALFDACARLCQSGWQPIELHRIVTRRTRPADGDLVADGIAAHVRDLPARTVDPRWREQADTVGARVWWGADADYLAALAARRRTDRVALLDTVLTVLTILAGLPPVAVLLPPPGQASDAVDPTPTAARPDRPAVDPRLLDRVRALLAKAESTTYPAEAEAYSAKAQELAARHSIDAVLLDARSGAVEVTPLARRIGVDPPHEQEKTSLLDAVARANRCQVVWSPEFGFATVFGFDADLDTVDLLYTSLLVQANQAMTRTEPSGGRAGRARLRGYRQSFLVGYAARIGERLAEVARTAVERAVPDAADLLPVLASREARVRGARERAFPRTVRGRGFRVDSLAGWDSGRDAADRATL
jgi:hypothetical protein